MRHTYMARQAGPSADNRTRLQIVSALSKQPWRLRAWAILSLAFLPFSCTLIAADVSQLRTCRHALEPILTRLLPTALLSAVCFAAAVAWAAGADDAPAGAAPPGAMQHSTGVHEPLLATGNAPKNKKKAQVCDASRAAFVPQWAPERQLQRLPKPWLDRQRVQPVALA